MSLLELRINAEKSVYFVEEKGYVVISIASKWSRARDRREVMLLEHELEQLERWLADRRLKRAAQATRVVRGPSEPSEF